MPKSISVTKRWTITEYKVVVPTTDFQTNGSIVVSGIVDILDANNVVLIAQAFNHTISGFDDNDVSKLDALLTSVATKSITNVGLGMSGPEAYYTATKDALYEQLELDGIIPIGAS